MASVVVSVCAGIWCDGVQRSSSRHLSYLTANEWFNGHYARPHNALHLGNFGIPNLQVGGSNPPRAAIEISQGPALKSHLRFDVRRCFDHCCSSIDRRAASVVWFLSHQCWTTLRVRLDG